MSGIPAGCTLRVTEVAEDRRARAACQRASFAVSAGMAPKNTVTDPEKSSQNMREHVEADISWDTQQKTWISNDFKSSAVYDRKWTQELLTRILSLVVQCSTPLYHFLEA